jgi:hypothetical protein
VLNPVLDKSSQTNEFYDKKSLLSIYLNFQKIIDLYKQFSVIMYPDQSRELIQNLEYISDKSFYAYLSVYKNKISLVFETKNNEQE